MLCSVQAGAVGGGHHATARDGIGMKSHAGVPETEHGSRITVQLHIASPPTYSHHPARPHPACGVPKRGSLAWPRRWRDPFRPIGVHELVLFRPARQGINHPM